MSAIRIGFIGTGGNGRGHVKAMAQVAAAEVTAFADISDESLQLGLGVLGRAVPTFHDYREMLDKVPLDGVVISTPHTLHFEQVMTCLDRGLHVLIEKPMTCTSAHARAIIRKQEETGKVVLVGYQRHYEPRFRWVRQQLQDGVLGRLTFIQCFQGQNWLRDQEGKWRQQPELGGGGQLNDSGSHLVDVVLWLTGLAAAEVSAYVDNRGKAVDVNSAVNVHFTNGAVGNISILGDQVARGMWEDITIAGEKGVIWMRQGGQTHMAVADAMQTRQITDFGAAPATNKDLNFVETILGRAENQVPPLCGLRVIELTEAVWRAAAAGGGPVPVEGE